MKIRGNTVGTPIKPEKVLVKSENLTEAEKAKARENIGAFGADMDGDVQFNGSGLCGVRKVQFEYAGKDILYTYATLIDEDVCKPMLEFYGWAEDDPVVFRHVADGVRDDDAVNVGQLNAAVGDIETALDSIIAIQESLIGGDS